MPRLIRVFAPTQSNRSLRSTNKSFCWFCHAIPMMEVLPNYFSKAWMWIWEVWSYTCHNFLHTCMNKRAVLKEIVSILINGSTNKGIGLCGIWHTPPDCTVLYWKTNKISVSYGKKLRNTSELENKQVLMNAIFKSNNNVNIFLTYVTVTVLSTIT